MIPSFYPLHQAIRAASGFNAAAGDDINIDIDIVQPSMDTETGLSQKTIDQLLAGAASFRYVDAPHTQYSELLQAEMRSVNLSPFTGDGLPPLDLQTRQLWRGTPPTVAVVGAGMAGLLTAFELQKLGMTVTLYEAAAVPMQGDPAWGTITGAGRIRALRLMDGEWYSRVELGAMRFPTRSYLFWHYVKLMLKPGASDLFTEFPNPSKVPSLFTDGGINGVWAAGGLKLPADYQDLNERHLKSLIDYSPPGLASGATVRSIQGLLLNGNPDANQLQVIKDFWRAASKDLYRKSYRQFLIDNRFTTDEIEKIGTTGLGTGGFAPLFPISVLDLIRLVIWEFDAEMEVPDLYLLPQRMLEAAQFVGVRARYKSPVTAIAYSPSARSYFVQSADSDVSGFEFLVLAMTHTAAGELLGASEHAAAPALKSAAPDAVYPLYDSRYTMFKSAIRDDLNAQGGMSAVKIFHTIAGPAFEGITLGPYQGGIQGRWPSVAPVTNTSFDPRVRAMYGRFTSGRHLPLGTSYVLKMDKSTAFAASDWVVGLHYSWGTDAVDVYQNGLLMDPVVGPAVRNTGVYRGFPYCSDSTFMGYVHGLSGILVDRLSQRFAGFTINQSVVGDPGRDLVPYFGFLHKRRNEGNDEGRFGVVYWDNVPYVKLGFKLDSPGVGAHLVYAYKQPTEGATDDTVWDTWDGQGYRRHSSLSGLYFAGDSFSHYGGWVEGAFQSALATTAAIAVNAFKRRGPGPDWSSQFNWPVIDALAYSTPNPYTDY